MEAEAVVARRQITVTPLDVFRSYWRHRSLIYQLARREILGRYRGSLLGLLWSLVNPILMLVVFTFVFSVVFKARWGTGDDNKAEFAIVLFAGLIVFSVFAECANRAPLLIVNNVNYVKKVVFPLEILPWVALATALFHAGISIVVLSVFALFAHGSLAWTILLFPLILVPLVLLSMGAAWILATLGVYVRDIGNVVALGTTVLLFISPIFFPASAIPSSFQWVVLFNPFAYLVEAARDVLLWSRVPDPLSLAAYVGGALVFAWLGLTLFQRMRPGFADVL